MDFRQTFGQDVVIDMVCYRRHGHNEGDEPAFTQPLMYAKIRERPSIVELYTEQLIMTGELTTDEAETIEETFKERLQAVYDEVHDTEAAPVHIQPGFQGTWKGLSPNYSFEPVETGVPFETLQRIAEALATVPEGFDRNPKLDRILQARIKTMESRGSLDWGFGEALAFGSLLLEGTPVRLSGQDSRRGTFSQRHAVLVDYHNGERYIPLEQPRARTRPSSASTTACSPRPRCSASTTATRSTSPTCSSCGRPSSATSPTAPRSSSTSSSPRPRASGAAPAAS